MVYKKPGGRSWTFQARTRHGHYPLTAPTTSKALAAKVEGMWEALAVEYRAWDLLEPILQAPRGERRARLGRLWDLWVETDRNVVAIRRQLQDVDLRPVLADYLVVLERSVGAGWYAHAKVHLEWLVPADTALRASTVTPEWLTQRLYAYPAQRNTLRRVHSSWSGFFLYAAKVRGLFPSNPMRDVDAPPAKAAALRFYEMDAVERIVGAQPSEDRRAFYALMYGAGIESSTALRLTRADFDMSTREVRAAGTKAHSRHRVAIVAEWAWEIVRPYLQAMLPTARLFPEAWSVTGVSRWHLDTVRTLKLPEAIKLHAARHHWAVTNLRAGVPVAVVQAQLGHSTPILALTTYGAFIPSGADRAHWARQTAEAERKRGAK